MGLASPAVTGLAPDVEILTLGEQSAAGCASSIASLRSARDHWGSVEVRERTCCTFVGARLPARHQPERVHVRPVFVVDGAEYAPERILSRNWPRYSISIRWTSAAKDRAQHSPGENEAGDWTAAVPVVVVTTDHGRLLLEVGRPVDVREGSRIVERRPEALEAGAILLVGRRQGRVGLLEALEGRLSHRPDLLAARFLVDNYRRVVRRRFAESRLTVTALHRALAALGCDKTTTAVRLWLTEGTMAPQRFDDLERLNKALDLGMSPLELRELFAGVQRRRGFRRAAGRALAAAARGATIVADESRVDADTGLSIADLREAVIEAVVLDVVHAEQPVPLTLVGTLEGL